MSEKNTLTKKWLPLIATKGLESEIPRSQEVDFRFYERMNVFLRVVKGKRPKLFRRFNIKYDES